MGQILDFFGSILNGEETKEPVFYKDDSDAEKQLSILQSLKMSAPEYLLDEINQEIKVLETGIYGENQVKFELQNSHIPMFVLHDIFLEYNGLSAQIDYIIITHKHIFVLECKNLYGNIEITNNGDFIRTFSYGKYYKKEGIYSPITQNKRHLDILYQIRKDQQGVLSGMFFEKNFYKTYCPIVVLSNPKTFLNAKYAKKEIRQQVIRADQLVQFIKNKNDNSDVSYLSFSEMKSLAEFFVSCSRENPVNYAENFKAKIRKKQEEISQKQQPPEPQEKTMLCPKCGAKMIKRVAQKGSLAGNEFYGCSNYPNCKCIINIQ